MSDIYELAVKLADRIMDEEITNRQSLVNVIEAEVTKWSTPRAADAAPRTDRALISELIHIAAELARGEGFLPTCAEDMNPRLKRADILKTAERQDLQLKDWANRVKQVVDKLSAVAGPRGDVADVLEVLAGRHHAQHHKQFDVGTCPAWPCDVLRGAATASPTGAESDDAHRCPHCKRLMRSDFDEDVGMWYECDNCDYREQVSSVTARTPVAGEQEYSEGFDDAARVSRVLNNVTAADTARLAAEELEPRLNPYWLDRDRLDQVAAIISKYFAAMQTNHDADRSATGLEAENERLKNAYNLAIQCVEFAQGKRKRGWDIQFVKEQLADAINPTPAN